MQIELEKKYLLTREDYKIIREKCKSEGEIELKDYYLDKDFILAKQNAYLRLRNGLYELKFCTYNKENMTVSSEEYDDEDTINEKLNTFGITTDDVTGIMFVHTKREKYSYNYKGQHINIDVEQYQYDMRYEIEIIYEGKKDDDRKEISLLLGELIENFRNTLGLTSENSMDASKTTTCAMHQNIELYNIMTGNKF